MRVATSGAPREEIEGLLAALGDGTRRKIFFSLMDREQSVKDLATPLGITLTGLGQHVRILESARLVSTRKVGRERICTVDPEGLERLEAFARLQKTLWRSRFDALRRTVEGD